MGEREIEQQKVKIERKEGGEREDSFVSAIYYSIKALKRGG